MLPATRTYLRRQGRLTEGQGRALDVLWPRYGLDLVPGRPIHLDDIFGRTAPRCLEIGFGTGETLLALAAAHPQNDYLGIDVYRPGIGRLLLHAQRLGLGNLRVIAADARVVLAQHLTMSSLDRILILFPDPWPKRRHHKRRLLDCSFVASLCRVLKLDGVVELATDWREYADSMRTVLEDRADLHNLHGPWGFAPPDSLLRAAPTKFECRGAQMGHCIWNLAYRRVGPSTRIKSPEPDLNS